MRRLEPRPGGRAWLGAGIGALLLWAGAATAQMLPGGAGDDSGLPVEIRADNAIELHQEEKAYVARGNAFAKRGDVSVQGDSLTAYYREVPGGGTEVYRLVAEGHVQIIGPEQHAFSDRAFYDVDQKALVLTGDDLRLVTPTDTITARDSLEYYEIKRIAVARGDAVAVREQSRLRADVLIGQFKDDTAPGAASGTPAGKPPAASKPGADKPGKDGKESGGGSSLERIDGHGHVVITTPGEVALSDQLIYTVATDIAVLTGNVRITRGDNQINGDVAEMNMKTRISRVLSSGGRISALLVPGQNGPGAPAGPGGAKPAPTKPADTKSADAKPTKAKPADAKPADTKPTKAKPAKARTP